MGENKGGVTYHVHGCDRTGVTDSGCSRNAWHQLHNLHHFRCGCMKGVGTDKTCDREDNFGKNSAATEIHMMIAHPVHKLSVSLQNLVWLY
jgi:hypothetical protein